MEILMKRRQFILEAKCLKVWTWGSWKSRHQNVSPSCLQLATKHMGEEEDSLLAQSEAAVTQEAQQYWKSQVQGTQTSLRSRCTIMLPVCMPHHCMELWHLQVGDCTQQAGNGACHGQHLIRVVSDANVSPVSLLQPRHFMLILFSKALRN